MHEYEFIHISKPDILRYHFLHSNLSNMHVADQSKLTIQDEFLLYTKIVMMTHHIISIHKN